MKNNKGFVMIETIIVISILALGLVSLYSSYALIMRKSVTNIEDNPINTYVAYQINQYKKYTFNDSGTFFTEVYKGGDTYYKRECGLYSGTYKCGTSSNVDISYEDVNIYKNLKVEKIYYTNRKFSELFDNNILLLFDGSTINYLQSIRNSEDIRDVTGDLTIVKMQSTGSDSTFSYYQYDPTSDTKFLRRAILGNGNSNVTSTLTIPSGRTPSLSNENVLASAFDDYGTSYYYRGLVNNNYVVFANMCWRIVRITGDGSIKLVLYNYSSSNCSQTGNSLAFAKYSKFNTYSNNNMYVGFMYGYSGYSYAGTHSNTNKSTILTNLENWYRSVLSGYSSNLADVVWCNDKAIANGQGYASYNTQYAAYDRIYNGSEVDMHCPYSYNNTSMFTVDTDGNHSLSYKIGLLTADEVAYAGGCHADYCSANYYLSQNARDNWWTMTPERYYSGAREYYVTYNGTLYGNLVTNNYALRPAVALLSSTMVYGEGTSTNPYVVVN